MSVRALLLLRCVLGGSGEHAQEFDESLGAVQYSSKMETILQESQVRRGNMKNPSSREVGRKAPPKLHSRGCALLCVNKDLVKSAILPGIGNESWDCQTIESYVLHEAAREDCVQLADHFAPLCCKSQLGHAPLNVSNCADCRDGCVVNGACFHSFSGWKLTQNHCVQHHGKWCGSTNADDGDEALQEDIDEDKPDDGKLDQGVLPAEEVEDIDEDKPDDGKLDQRVPPAEEVDEMVTHSDATAEPTTDPDASTEDAAVLMQGNNTEARRGGTGHRRRALFIPWLKGHCHATETWMSSSWNSNNELQYHTSDYCMFLILRPVAVSLLAFETEKGYDKLTVQGKTFEGSFKSVQTKLDGLLMNPGDTIVWTADSSVHKKGWQLMVSPFERIGKGRCSEGGVYKTFSGADLQYALDVCLEDAKCMYVSYELNHYTMLYSFLAKECSLVDAHTNEVVYRKVEKHWPCCKGGDFVHTNDDCSSNSVYLSKGGDNWHSGGTYLPSGRRRYAGYSDQKWGGTTGKNTVHWYCSARRRRCGWPFGCGSGAWESTGFSPPSNGGQVRVQSGQLDFWPRYCPPKSINVRTSPLSRGCCSIADGTQDACSSANFIQIKVSNRWQKCYKGQTCEWELDEPQSQGVRLDWYCGYDAKEGVSWGLYFDTLQVKLHCNGKVEWNPWWCGRATQGELPPSLITSLSALVGMNETTTPQGAVMNVFVDGTTGVELNTNQLETKLDDWVLANKGPICEGPSASAVYDQLLKPSGVCWRSGCEARSSLFHHHSDYGTKLSLLEDGTAVKRSDRKHSSPWLQVLEMFQRNTTLLELAASSNTDPQSLRELEETVGQQIKLSSGGTDCNKIGKIECGWYCAVNTLDCVDVTFNKINKVILFVAELAADIAMACATGGAANAAKAAAKTTAKATAKAVLKRAGAQSFKSTIKSTAQAARAATKRHAQKFAQDVGLDKAAKYVGRKYTEHLKGRLQGRVMKKYMYTWEDAAKDMVKEAQDRMNTAFRKALAKVSCESTVKELMEDGIDDPSWVNSPSFKWGNGEGFGGYLEIMDITGIVSLVGAFHEADCPAPIPGKADGNSCPR